MDSEHIEKWTKNIYIMDSKPLAMTDGSLFFYIQVDYER